MPPSFKKHWKIQEMESMSPKKAKRIRHDTERAIQRWAERINHSISLFDSIELLNRLNTISISAAQSEEGHTAAPDCFVNKFKHIRNLTVRRPLHSAKSDKNISLEILFQHVDKLFTEIIRSLLLSAHTQKEARPELRASIEAWFDSRARDLNEPPLGSSRRFRQLFLDRFGQFSDTLIRPSFFLSSEECIKALDSICDIIEERLNNPSALDSENAAFILSPDELADASGLQSDAVARFMKSACLTAGSCNESYISPTDVADPGLFLNAGTGQFYILDVMSLHREFFSLAERSIAKTKVRADKYYDWRGKIVPRNVARGLARIFGEQNVFENLFYSPSDRPDDLAEADIIVRHEEAILLCEVKGREVSRDISSPVGPDRMDREFKTIQEGYNQCLRTYGHISKSSPALFYTSDRSSVLLSISGPIREFHFLVITANSFGCLAGNCSDLLRRQAGDPLPVVMSEFEISELIELVHSPAELLKYFSQRVLLHGFLKTADELEVAGVFVTQRSLDYLLALKNSNMCEHLVLCQDTAYVFNGPEWERAPDSGKELFAFLVSPTGEHKSKQ